MFQSWSSSSRVASCVSAENGSLPRSMKYKMTPAAKTSTFGQSQVRWNSKIQWKPPWSTMVLPSIFPMKTATRYHRKTKFGPMVWYPPFWDRPKLQLIVAIVVSTANRPINLDIKNINPTRHMDRENDLNIFRIIQNYSNLDQICRVIFFCAHGSHLSKRLFRCKACA